MTPPPDGHDDDPPPRFSVADHPGARRYELRVDDEVVSFADYHRHDSVVVVTHVETAVPWREQGMSDRLMRGLLDDLHARDLLIEPVCRVARTYVVGRPDDAALLAS